MTRSGELERLRQTQREKQMWTQIESELIRKFRTSASVQKNLSIIQSELRRKQITPGAAAEKLLSVLDS